MAPPRGAARTCAPQQQLRGRSGTRPLGRTLQRIHPEEELTEIPWRPGKYLRSDAVASLIALNEEFKAEFGYNLGISDAYRDFAGQVEAKQKYGKGADTPGKSNHGWALAVDFGTGIASFGTPQYRWMKEHAADFGWRHPAWAEPGARLPEPWHWEFWGWAAPGADLAVGGAPSDAKEFARKALGGDSLQYGCLERLWTGESNWNPLAKNPSSGAYGIPQALPAEKLATAGADWLTNGVTQVKWGLTYIKDRYGTPCDAWSFWQSNNPHWY
ncbi:D-alanyl-D-alanine carboxypeptidase family protein [Microbacterium sp. TPU 3598]|uniref:aggregation-promoting factor C-terminal-like domain-containing protein n=1 Tax=Microbacterium sp. TPU 3598 TaxID=1938334 RepID=UPI002F910F18